ncbi:MULTISPECIES: PAS domain-containing sensor histidine kinase [unclassified Corallococcus]|uniref:PAS domain-containing sensor histidine kinase n=1 Tax=unclassified Corallococcus TaxID=2685029 RepID=UPI001A8C5E11|nr:MULTISPECIES: ATP-binding protein [unclassified Corallococcus]MBN9684837.1 PAS domain-containing protein [Corallococcus sp. NCSPR001]WAS83698.1 PAS domain-containing protein [Corallococcus sp. NCRR]
MLTSFSPQHLVRILAVAAACAVLMGLVAAWSESQSAGVRLALVAVSAFVLAAVGALAALRAMARSERECARLLNQANDARALRDAVMDITPVGFAFYDRDLRYVHVNAALAAMNGLPVAAHLGRHVAEVLPALGTVLAPRLARALESDAPLQDLSLQVETPAAPGETRFWFGSYSRVRGSGGAVLGVIASLSEVTERMRAEASLQEHEGRLDVLTRSLPDYLWGGKLRDGVLRDFYCTPVVERTTGFPASAFTAGGGPEGTPSPLWAEMIHPEDRTRYRECIESLALAPSTEVEIEHRIICADGRVRWVRSRAAASGLDDRGGVHLGCVVTDVTDRRLADDLRQRLNDSFRRSATEWRRTFDAVASPLLVLSAEGIIHRLNEAARLLFREADPSGQPLSVTAGAPPWSSAGPLVEELRATHGSTSRQVHDAESHRTWEVSAAWVDEKASEDPRIILVATEVTRLLELQAHVRRSETMAAMGAIVAGVAHEVRNPLFSISAVVDAIEATYGAQPELKPYLDVLRGEVRRLTHLTQELFEYGRPTRGEWTDGAVGAVVSEALSACMLTSDKAAVKLEREVSDALPPVRMDARRLFHVFRNVVENAVQHSPQGTTVHVTAETVEEAGRPWVRCTVHDGGPGFKSEDLPHVFEPFFSKRRGGTGLGLSIVQRILEEHQGRIRLSNHPQGGAEVTILLPALSPAVHTGTTPQSQVS